MIHSMKRMKGTKRFMAVKIDFEKAYDRLNWNFLKKSLIDFGFPQHFIDIVMACISSVKSRVLWNGCQSNEFVPQRGIRQGTPSSPTFL